MSDNVSQLNIPQRKRIVKRILMIAAAVVLVLLVLFAIIYRDRLNMDTIRRRLKYLDVSGAGKEGQFSFDAHSSNRYVGLGDGLAVGAVSGLTIYAADGSQTAEVQLQTAAPEVKTAGDTALYYDVVGTELRCVRENGEVIVSETTQKPIFSADVSSDGCICYCAQIGGYKSALSVYNREGKMIYRWLSASSYLPLCTVSSKAERAAAVSLGQKNGQFQSFAEVFQTDSEQPLYTLTLGNELIYELKYLTDGTLLSIGEHTAMWFSDDGTLRGQYSYEDAYLKDFDTAGSGFLTLCLNMNKSGNQYLLVTLTPDGQEHGRLELSREVLDFSCAGKYVGVLTSEGLTVYDSAFHTIASGEYRPGASDVVMRSDGTAILIGGGSGELFIP